MRLRLLCALIISLLITRSAEAQVVAGIRANGIIRPHGDTINVCRGNTVTYQSAAQGSLNISWLFTNGGTTTTATGIGPVTITYNTVGFDTAFQKVVGGAFADSTFIIVRISDVFPVAGYTFSPDNVCGNENIQFTNTSTNGAPLTYLWNFADATASSLQNPVHQFLSAIGLPGTQVFPVKLVVTNVYGCKDSVIQPVTIKRIPDAAIGNADPSVLFGPFNGIPTFKKCSNIPSYNFKFQNLSTTLANNVSYTIQWGDGVSPDSTFTSWPAGQVIGHTFPLGGSTMTMNVTGPDGCIGIKRYTIFLGTNPAGGLASLGNADVCSSDSLRFVITNTENNPPGTTYTFLINDYLIPQTFQHPPPTTVAHYFNNGSCFSSSNNGLQTYNNAFGAYLTIENPCGSNSASVVPIYVSGKPRPLIALPTPVVCVNTPVTVTNASSFGNVVTSTGTFTSDCMNSGVKVWSISPATGYTLLAGSLGSLNGSPTNGLLWTNASNSLDILFTATGTYTIKIYVFNERCGMDSTERTICVRNPPQASFTLSQHSSCGPVTINPDNTSPPGGCQGDDYEWQITYSDPQGCAPPGATYSFVGGTNFLSAFPSIAFNRVGRYVIRLIVRAHNSPYGCPEVFTTDTFYVKGPPVAAVAAINTVCVNNTISPSATINNCYAPGPFGYQWTFTNGTPSASTGLLPGNILYSNAGTYPVRFIVTDSSCMLSDTVNTTVSIFPAPLSEAGTDASVCSGTAVPVGMTPVSGVTYQWTPATGLNNPNIANPVSTLTYTGPSLDTVYTYYLTASMGGNCFSTDSVKITVRRKPVVTISPASAQICINTSVSLTANGADNYVWTPATGLNNTGTATVTANPLATIAYSVTGTLTNGCTDEEPVTVTVYPDADANIIVGDTIKCSPVNINTLITNVPYPPGNGTYNWYADNVLIGSNTTGVVPSYVLNLPGDTTTIKLVTISPYGCKADSVQKTFITRPAVTALFTKDRDSSCAPLNVLFTNTSTVLGSGVEFYWNFGNGITSTAVQPGTIMFDTSPAFRDTVYKIVLKAYNGCDTSYYRDSVKVFANSKARFAVDTTRGCSPFTLHIQNTSLGNNFAYYWDFGDGQTDTTYALTSFTHTYYTGTIQNFTISLISENQCTRDTQTLVIVVNPNTIQPFVTAFGNQLSGCAPHAVTFNNSSIGAAQLTWNFGDGSPLVIIPNSQNSINHLYNNPGVYTVIIRLQNDCSDTTIQRMVTVYDPPVAGFSVAPIRICTNQAVAVSNTSINANSYEWQWGDGNSSTFTNGQHTYNTPGDYTITLIAKKVHSSGFICYDTTTHNITVVDKIPAQIVVAPGNTCAPYTLNVNAGNITGYHSVNWVVYDSSTSQGEFHLAGPSATHVYDVPGNYSVKLIIHTTPGCVDSVTYSFRVYHTPKTTFQPQLVKTCSHDTTVNYTAISTDTGNEPITYKWFVNGSIEGTTPAFSYNFQTGLYNAAPVEYNIQALAQNAAGCGDTSWIGKMIIQPLPWPGIVVSPSVVIQQPDYTFGFKDTVATNPNKTYTWSMGDRSLQTKDGREISYTYSDTGTYNVRLLVTDFTTGCSAKDSVQVTIQYIPGFLYVPNAMCLGCSNAGLRQFLPLGKGLKTYRLRIYNAFGQLIFETNKLDANGAPSEPWNGTHGGKPNSPVLQQDTYTWQIEATYTNGTEWKGMLYPGSNKATKAGFITIVK
ncbi:MAG: PKD domain-containing protein [Chitinophagaceae bacterium]|nr:PKD domain-containing protein [Chitinophagaceae bacterium]